MYGPLTVGASLGGAQALGGMGLSSRSWQAHELRMAQLLRGMRDLPRAGMALTSTALAGRFLTTLPPGKFQKASEFCPSSQNPHFQSPLGHPTGALNATKLQVHHCPPLETQAKERKQRYKTWRKDEGTNLAEETRRRLFNR